MKYWVGLFLVTTLLLSCNSNRQASSNDVFEAKEVLRQKDSIFYNDSTFAIVSYSDKKLDSIELYRPIPNTEDKHLRIQTLRFHSNGVLKSVNMNVKPGKLEDSMFYYELQSLQFDDFGNLGSYRLMYDYKIDAEMVRRSNKLSESE